MSDFFQNGVIATLHRLGRQNPDALEERLIAHSRVMPTALILPCLIGELDGPALGPIVETLARTRYLGEFVIALGRADRRDFERARRFFDPLGPRARILWIEGPRVTEFIRQLADNELDIGSPGKGRATWLSIGCVLGGRSAAMVLHDADILTYDRNLLARLCYPLMDPSLGYEYVKGYYSRVTDRLHGRVTRLFLTPLIRALVHVIGSTPFLRYMDSFRYALAGEFGMTIDLARSVRFPGDWGLEVGVLAEVYRNTAMRRVCQVDVLDNYDHKHQALSPEDESTGLNRMTRDIAKSLLRTITMEGFASPDGFYNTLKVTYLRMAEDAVRTYHDDAVVNGLQFDRHSETLAVEVFSRSLSRACDEFRAAPLAYFGMPNWNRVTSAIPGVLEQFREAIEKDNA